MPDDFVNFDGLYEGELPAFDVYFASVRSLQFHPGAGTKEHVVLSVAQCADEAMQMIKARRKAAVGV